MRADLRIEPGTPWPLGPTPTAHGANFTLFSHYATSVTLALFAPEDAAPRLEITLDPHRHRTGDLWHAAVIGVEPGDGYAFRLDGPRTAVHRFDPARYVIDPCARALEGGHDWGAARRPPLRAILVDEAFDWGDDRPPRTPLADTVIYELHVRGFTRDASSGVRHPGTFAGLIEKIPYLRSLGVTAVELMPITEFDETFVASPANPLTGERLLNYWGYNPIAFFAPKASYAADTSAGGAIREFKRLVQALHASGLEVILDVVFNHTGEGPIDGPTSSFRGIDNATYYMTNPPTGAYRDFTGCGNTFNCNHPAPRELIVTCLRYWATEMHVDGFRFDLASVLDRGPDGEALTRPPLLERIAADPVLAPAKLIAEPWDASALYQVGMFPAWGRWAEWNGRFRDDVRRFVRGDAGLAGAIATRLAGSPDLYRADGHRADRSINFVTSHDGFTLADLVAYDRKHNDANGEGSRDGADDNDSWNCGWEGEGASPPVERLREQQMRNLLAILLLAQGVPMILAGDERARTQLGNNNPYCQDSPLSWVHWNDDDRAVALRRFVTDLIALRGAREELRAGRFLDAESEGRSSAEWHGREPGQPDWSSGSRLVVMQVHGAASRGDLLVAINAHPEPVTIRLPEAAPGKAWRRIVDTAGETPAHAVEGAVVLAARSVVVLEG